MKKEKRWLFVAITILLLFGTACDVDPYKGHRPMDYGESVWVCKEYDITYTVNGIEKGNSTSLIMIRNGKIFELAFLWSALDSGVTIQSIDDQGNHKNEFSGRCTFGKSEFLIYVEDSKGFFDENNVTLRFVRQ